MTVKTKEIDTVELPINQETIEEIAKIQNGGNTVKATVTVNLGKNKTVKQDFVMAYTDNLQMLADLKLSATQFRIIAYIVKAMEYGNLISFSQTQMGLELNIAKSNISYNFNQLISRGVIIRKDGHLYMNSNIFQKGLMHKLSPERRKQLKDSQGEKLTHENGELAILKPTI